MPKSENITLKNCFVGGLLLTGCSISLVTLTVLVVTWFQDGFAAALAGFGIALLLASGAMLFSPVFGAMVSLGNRSWTAFKLWSGAGVVAMLLNGVIGLLAIGIAQLI
jgi:hypothetical protein